jgi:hypothetical protein
MELRESIIPQGVVKEGRKPEEAKKGDSALQLNSARLARYGIALTSRETEVGRRQKKTIAKW